MSYTFHFRVFLVIEMMHQQSKLYTYSEAAMPEAQNYYDGQQRYLAAHHADDPYYAGIMLKLFSEFITV